MNLFLKLALYIALAALLVACGGDDKSGSTPVPVAENPGTTDPPVDDEPPGNGGDPIAPAPPTAERPTGQTCLAGARPAPGPVRLERAFAPLGFVVPVQIIQSPRQDERWYVVEKAGRIATFTANAPAPAAVTVLNMPERVDERSEGGLLSMAFDPRFPAQPFVYVYYTTSDDAARDNGGNFRSVVSRFAYDSTTHTIDPASELQLLVVAQPFGNHNGGMIAFGLDNYLYIGLGDGGSGGDPQNHGQRLETLLGAMLRIDVLNPRAGQPYAIPPDNPFADSSGCASGRCPEIYAWGLRNPWRWSFDRLSGDLWAADVGQDSFEEINLIENGKNYGWRCYEGSASFNLNGCADPANFTAPLYAYAHVSGAVNSVTGGFVYRGTRLPQLTGRYVFGDFGTGNIYVLSRNADGTAGVETLLESGLQIASFAEDRDGELYVVSFDGTLHRFTPGAVSAPSVAERLSQSGCADAAQPQRAAATMLPYAVNAPLWSDSARKERWLALPDNATITLGDDGDWDFPPGTVMRKDFLIEQRRVETRLLKRHDDGGWAGYSYQWLADGSDALLLADGAESQVGDIVWRFPSPVQCLQCHTAAAGRSLGLETAQLDRPGVGPLAAVNQLAFWNEMGLFGSSAGSELARFDALSNIDDANLPLAQRARSYLHSNCGGCHRPGGPGGGALDLRYSVALAQTGACDSIPLSGDLGIPGARVIAPGDPDRSVLVQRMSSVGETRMPPLGSALVDANAVAVLRAWIAELPAAACQ